MPTYKYPKESYPKGVLSNETTEKRQPTLHMPAGPEQVQPLEIGDNVEVTLKGKVRATSVRKDEEDPGNDATLELELVESDVYATGKGKKNKKESAAESESAGPYADMVDGE